MLLSFLRGCICRLGDFAVSRVFGCVGGVLSDELFMGELFACELLEYVPHLVHGGFLPEVFLPANSLTHRARYFGAHVVEGAVVATV